MILDWMPLGGSRKGMQHRAHQCGGFILEHHPEEWKLAAKQVQERIKPRCICKQPAMRRKKKCYRHPGLEKSPREGSECIVPLLKESAVILFLGLCSSFHPIAVINTVIKSNLGEGRFLWLIPPGHNASLSEIGPGT